MRGGAFGRGARQRLEGQRAAVEIVQGAIVGREPVAAGLGPELGEAKPQHRHVGSLAVSQRRSVGAALAQRNGVGQHVSHPMFVFCSMP